MRILIYHGYLLRGTGSNVYNAELARALLAAGHDVDIVCQERRARELEWVDALGDWDHGGRLSIEDLQRSRAAGRGRCTLYRPPIADQLPVYVEDDYEGFDARTFDRFDDEELAFHIARNVMAVREVVARTRPDFGLANHMIIGPYVLAEAFAGEIPFVVKIHGSAMEYIVRRHPRFLPYAVDGVSAARAVLVGSRHIAERTWDTLRIERLEERLWLGPPGVDTEAFRPREREGARAGLAEIAEEVFALPRDGYGPAQVEATAALLERVAIAARTGGTMAYEEVAEAIGELQRQYRTDGVDTTAGDRLRELAAIGEAPLALYVGKLILSKGVDLLLASWPLVLAERPDAKLLIVGFGAHREGLEMLLDALSAGDLATARWMAEGGRAFEGGEAGRLTILGDFLGSLVGERLEAYAAAARNMRGSVCFLGRLDHDLLAPIIPAADCQVVPSTFPEAFGMVAAEAAACGVPPICAGHSGLLEVTERLERNLSGVAASILTFRVSESSVDQIASRVLSGFGLTDFQRAELSARLAQTAETEFSWHGVARNLVAAGSGANESLRRP
jgi:glycosyltransferase involved in cell wall biosynthesis